MPYLSIHIKTNPSGLIKQPCILVSYHNSDNLGILKKMLNHRLVEQQFALKRICSDDEYETEANKYRVGFIVYKSWKALIDDEMKFTADAKYLANLQALSKKYKQLEIQQGELF